MNTTAIESTECGWMGYMSYVLGSGDGHAHWIWNICDGKTQPQQQQHGSNINSTAATPKARQQHQQQGSNNKDPCPVRQYEEPLLSRRSYRVTHFVWKFAQEEGNGTCATTLRGKRNPNGSETMKLPSNNALLGKTRIL